MSVGIISYMTERGLGTMCHDLRKQLGINRQMVIPDGGWCMREDWANGEELYLFEWEVQRLDLALWQQADKIDTLISIETGFGDHTFRWAKELGMRTILIVMWEHFNPHQPAYQNVDLYVCPSFRAFQEIPFDNKIFLPYPVDLDEFPFRQRNGAAKMFVHNAGSGGMNGRKGTRETIDAFILADPIALDIHLIVRSQVPLDQIYPGIEARIAGALSSRIHIEGGKPNRADLYIEGDVLVYPSRYDGHSLVGLEGMASGMPVITTDAEPMNEFWMKAGYSLLVKVAERQPAGTVNPHCMAHIVSVCDLAEKIRWSATNDLSDISQSNRQIVERAHSWTAVRDRWMDKLGLR